MKLKIQRGTVTDTGRSLCESCRHSTIIRGHKLDHELTFCTKIRAEYDDSKGRVPFAVSSCSEYDNKATPELWEMKQIAWRLRTDTSGRKIGFMSPDDWRELKKKEDPGVDPDRNDPVWDPIKREKIY